MRDADRLAQPDGQLLEAMYLCAACEGDVPPDEECAERPDGAAVSAVQCSGPCKECVRPRPFGLRACRARLFVCPRGRAHSPRSACSTRAAPAERAARVAGSALHAQRSGCELRSSAQRAWAGANARAWTARLLRLQRAGASGCLRRSGPRSSSHHKATLTVHRHSLLQRAKPCPRQFLTRLRALTARPPTRPRPQPSQQPWRGPTPWSPSSSATKARPSEPGPARSPPFR